MKIKDLESNKVQSKCVLENINLKLFRSLIKRKENMIKKQ